MKACEISKTNQTVYYPKTVSQTAKIITSEYRPITMRSGGHSYIEPDNDAAILDTTQLNGQLFSLENGMVTVPMGMRLGQLYPKLIEQGLISVGGSCFDVGVGGLVLGGGLSVIMRLYGTACDNIVSATAVMADGCLRTIDSKDKDLFWMIKGGGEGLAAFNSVTLRTHILPVVTWDFRAVLNNWSDAFTVLKLLQDPIYNKSIPPHVWYQVKLTTKSMKILCHMHGNKWGLPKNIAKYFTIYYYERNNYTDSINFWNGKPSPTGSVYSRISSMQYDPLDDEGIRIILRNLDNPTSANVSVLLDLMGGNLPKYSGTTAFPHHKAMFSWQYLIITQPDGLKTAEGWMYSVYHKMLPYMKGTYVGYCNKIIKTPMYFLDNYPRVRDLQKKYNNGRFVVLYDKPHGCLNANHQAP